MKFNLKEKFSKIDKNKIKDKIKNFNPKDFKKNINKEKIIDFWYTNKNKTITILLLPVILIAFIYTIILWFDVKNKYDKVQTNIAEIKKVKNKQIIKLIKDNKLRSLNTVINTAYILNKKHSISDYENTLGKILIISMLNNKFYRNKIDYIIFDNSNDTKKEKINSILKLNKKYNSKLYNKYIQFINSSYVNTYLSSLLDKGFNVWEYRPKFNKDIYKTLLDVTKNLYIYELVFIEDNLKKEQLKYERIKESYTYPYTKFLTYVLLPSVNIWKNKFSWKINVDVFWSKYLNKASFVDLNLVKYWSNYFVNSYKWKLYQWERNIIDNILVWDFNLLKDTNLAQLPIKVSFWLNDDKSFYWLISKLTLTSDKKNLMTINEFTYYLWKNVKNNIINFIWVGDDKVNNKKVPIWKKYIATLVYKCIYKKWNFKSLSCWKVFGCTDDNSCSVDDFSSDIIKTFSDKVLAYNIGQDFIDALKSILANKANYDFNDSFINKYFINWYDKIDSIDTLIWARLYDCLINDAYCIDLFKKDNDDYYWIKKTIMDFAWCSKWKIDKTCKFNFINKFDTNYFIAYTMVDKFNNINDYTFLDRLKDVYKNISWLLEIWKFTFKNLNNSISDLSNIKYKATSSLKVYYNYLSDKDLNDILDFIWKYKCSYVTNWKKWSLDIAYNYIKWIKNNIYKTNLSASAVYNLEKILSIIENLKKDYKTKNNLEKVLANLQVYRILKERWDCSK